MHTKKITSICRWLTSICRWLTGGRPMKRKGFILIDQVVHKPVYEYHDLFGREWMAFGPWSLFRIEYNLYGD